MKHSVYKIVGQLCLILTFAVTANQALAQSSQYKRAKKNTVNKKKAPAKKSGKENMKVDLTDIENKYWAPKDDNFSVVQNRSYTKAKRFSLSLQTGPMINDTLSTGFTSSVTANYFFTERHGVEINYIKGDLDDSKAVQNFLRDVAGTGGVKPDFGRLDNFLGVSYNWVPIYAKMSLLEKKIFYFDMAISPGIGMINYNKQSQVGNVSESSVAITLDITQYYFLNNHWAIRADYKNRWFTEKRIQYKTGIDIADTNTHNAIFLIGVTYYH